MPRPSLKAERTEEILKAFEACALRKGLAATTLNDVAEEAGLPRPLVRHFMGNRAALVSGLIERIILRTTAAIEQSIAAAGATEAQSEEADAALLAILLGKTFVDRDTNRLMIQLWQQAWHDDALHEELTGVYRRSIQQIHDRLFPGDTAAANYDLAFAITAMAMGYGMLSEFKLQPRQDDALLRAGQAIAALSSTR